MKSGLIAAAFLAALSLGACTHQGGGPQSDRILIGEVGSMTGSEATFGLSTDQAIQLGVREINAAGGIRGHKLEVIALDDRGNSSDAALATTQLITQKKVIALLGEVASSKSLAMAPIAQQYGIPMITPSSINSRITQTGDFIFRVCFTDRFQSWAMAKFALGHLHAKTAAILSDTANDYSVDSARIFTEVFEKGGGHIALERGYASGDIDFKSQLTAIAAQSPDVILVPGYYTDVGLIARQAKQLGIKAPLLGGDGWDSPKLVEIGAGALEGSYFVTHFFRGDPSPGVAKFVDLYRGTYGAEPDGLAALGYDALHVLADAMARAPDTSPTELRKAISATHDFAGVTGKISINSDRNAVKDAVVIAIGPNGALSVADHIHPE